MTPGNPCCKIYSSMPPERLPGSFYLQKTVNHNSYIIKTELTSIPESD